MNELTSDIIKQQIATLEAELLQANNSGEPLAVKHQLMQRINMLKDQVGEPLPGKETASINDDDRTPADEE